MKNLGWYAGWNMIAVAILFQAVSVGTISYGFTFWIGPWTREFAVGRADIMGAFVGFTIVVGAVSGAMLLAWIRDQTGSYDAGLMAALGAMISAAVLIAWLPKAENSKRLVLQQ